MSYIASIIGALLFLVSLPLCADDLPSAVPVEVWHTYGVDSEEERLFIEAVERFSAANPDVVAQIVRIPFLQNLQQFTMGSK